MYCFSAIAVASPRLLCGSVFQPQHRFPTSFMSSSMRCKQFWEHFLGPGEINGKNPPKFKGKLLQVEKQILGCFYNQSSLLHLL